MSSNARPAWIVFSRPVDGTFAISRYYGEKDKKYEWSIDPDNGFWIPIRHKSGLGNHRGTDFSCPSGTIVRAMCDGFIVRARYESALDFKFGNGLYILQLVSLPGFDSWTLRYSHLNRLLVEPGTIVYRHQPIAESGATGATDGEYLHVDLMNIKRQWKAAPLEG